jgi:lipid A 4'-phosphatase
MNAPSAVGSQARTAAHGDWRWRDREWAWFAAALVAVCAPFALWPELDLVIAGALRDGEGAFVGRRSTPLLVLYEAVPWLGRGAALAALLAFLLWPRGSGPLGRRWWRRLLMLGLALLVGVGVVVNGLMKEGWGRARPVAVTAFGGAAEFSPALRPVRACRTNCSFVSGHAATGFALGAVGLFGAAATRRRWLLAGLCAGLAIGAMRVAQGAHFPSDVLFAGVLIWGCNLSLRALWLRHRLLSLRRRSLWRPGPDAGATAAPGQAAGRHCEDPG